MKTFTRQYPVGTYLLSTFFFSWIIGVILAIFLGILEKQLGLTEKPFSNLFAKYGPTIGGIFTIFLLSGSTGAKKFVLNGLKLNNSYGLLAMALLGPFLILSIAATISGFTFETLEFSVSWIPLYAGLFASKLLFGGGFGEEYGWRGFMVTHQKQQHNLITVSLLVGMAWVIWHLPAYALGNKSVDDPLFPFTLQVMGISFVFTWFYIRSRESVMIVAILHGSFNASLTLFEQLFQLDKVPHDLYLSYYWAFSLLCLLLGILTAAFSPLFKVQHARETPL